MLLLTLVVGGGVSLSIPKNEWFYLYCITVEMLVLLSAIKLRAIGSKTIVWLSILLVIWHVIGYITDGSRADSPYRLLVQFTEHAELIMLIILSNPILKYKKESHV